MEGHTTLRAVLTQSKPAIQCRAKASRNTTSKNWPGVDASAIKQWHAFNLNTLNESYGHMLDILVPATELRTPRPQDALNGVEIVQAADIRHLVA